MFDWVQEEKYTSSLTIAILTRADFRSPRILADSLKLQLEEMSVSVEIFDEINLLNRLVDFRNSQLSFHFWLERKIKNYFRDRRLLKKLRKFDAIVISECIPNAFLKRLYNIEKLKRLSNKPVGLYEVYYLGNAPTQIDFLKKSSDVLLATYDFQLSVSSLTEIKQPACENWYPIGIKAESWNLKPLPKKEMLAIVDFAQAGYEQYRQIQIRALDKAGINYISLERTYTIEEIRTIYQQGSIFLIQFPEAFGVSILECFCCGCQIFTPDSGWPMSWRLDGNPKVHARGTLPECFTVYENEEQLIEKLVKFKESFNSIKTPKRIFDLFEEHYPTFYYGNKLELGRLIEKLL